MPTHKPFKLSPEDFAECSRIIRIRNIPVWKYKRVKILLLLHEGLTYKKIESETDTNSHTISQWKSRYLEEGMEGLKDRPRPGQTKKITEEVEAKVLAAVQEKPPAGKTHWSNYDLGAKVGLHPRRVCEILNRHNIKPHLHRYFMVSNDPEFEQKASEIIGLYISPPKNAAVLCVDEKTSIQALDRMQPNLPLSPNRTERSTFEYRRNGVTSLFAAFNTRTGEVTGDCKDSHTQYDFIDFLNKLDKVYENREIHIILDNFRAHKTAAVEEWKTEHPNWKFHFTPTYSSWLNQVECWFSIISRKCIRRGVFDSTKDLISKIKAFIKDYNKKAKPFVWKYNDPSSRITV
ncbi:MAG TPA: IS630 family transposase [Leptospiraceae bacterium]|nr:IS630 family transposase [Leptospiraceae bacterium]